MNHSTKAGLISGITLGVAAGIFYTMLLGPLTGCLLGAGHGLLIGFLAGAYTGHSIRRMQQDRPKIRGEKILREGPAGYDWEGDDDEPALVTIKLQRGTLPGWICLTDRRLLFQSAVSAFYPEQIVSINLSDIAETIPGMKLLLFPTALKIVTHSGSEVGFVLEKRTAWRNDIEAARRLAARREMEAAGGGSESGAAE